MAGRLIPYVLLELVKRRREDDARFERRSFSMTELDKTAVLRIGSEHTYFRFVGQLEADSEAGYIGRTAVKLIFYGK